MPTDRERSHWPGTLKLTLFLLWVIALDGKAWPPEIPLGILLFWFLVDSEHAQMSGPRGTGGEG